MMNRQAGHPARRALVLIVGRESRLRAMLAQEMIERGHSIVLCSGPPGCSLLHDDACVLVDRADVAVILPFPAESSARPFLQGCAASARRAVFVTQPPFATPAGSTIVGATSPDAIARAVDAAVRRGAA